MDKKPLFLIAMILLSPVNLSSQSHYEVSRAAFCSPGYDEFCPVIYQDQLVFCSDREQELLITYRNGKNRGLLNLFTVRADQESGQKDPEIFSKDLVTPYNDGPAAFMKGDSLMVYSRNLDIRRKVGNVSDESNRLGLFFAIRSEGEWVPFSGFPFNSKDYSITTPCFSPDRRYLYFGSDMPGGYGGADLYCSELINGVWQKPVNLGPLVNTTGNEAYPFVAGNGDLYFASDGHPGLGRKDIFVSKNSEAGWTLAAHIDAPINSEEDDFGILTNSTFSEGYFSSSRNGSDDIFRFTTLVPQLFGCDSMLENQYCFEFWDDHYPGTDSLPVVYEWSFSDGSKLRGLTVEHCFPGAGKYRARLNIIDSTTSIIFSTQSSLEFEIKDQIQPYITSPDVYPVNREMEFSGLDSNLPDHTIEKYIWDFGDGSSGLGPEIRHRYGRPGIYDVKLGVTVRNEGGKSGETICVIKQLTIVPVNQTIHRKENNGIVSGNLLPDYPYELPLSRNGHMNSAGHKMIH